MQRILCLLAALMLLAAPAFAGDKPVMQKPHEIAPYIRTSEAYGQGTLHKLFMKVYDTSLWTDAKDWSMKETFALCIRYNMNFKVKELVDRSITEMERTGKLSDDEKASYRKQLTAGFHDVHPGDVISAVYQPKKGVTFFYDGKKNGTGLGAALSERFMNIWLGPDTSEPALRRELIARK
jgi:hypothetical protein